MNVATALRSGIRIPVQCFWTVLPFYLLATGTTVAARVPFLAGLAIALAALRVEGRIEPVVRALDRLEPGQVDSADPTTLSPELIGALGGLVTPTVMIVLGVSIIVSLVVGIVFQAVATAGTFSAIDAALDTRDPLAAGVRGLVRHWQTFVGLALLRLVLVGVSLVPLGIGVAAAAAVGGPIALVGAAFLGLVSVVLLLVTLLALSFVSPAVVVDDVGVRGSVRGSLGFIRHHPVNFLLYVVITVGVAISVGALAGLLNFVGTARLVGVVTPLLVAPVVGGFQTALYAESELSVPRVDGSGQRASATSRRARVSGGVARGWRELKRFVATHPLANLGGGALLTVGIAAGWAFTAPYGVALDAPQDVAGVFGTVAVGPFVNIAANNWLVAVSGSYGGLALGVPTAAGLLFNGALVGALAGIFDRIAFLALVAPHGVIELPALAIAGGLGLHLGRVGLGGLRGRLSAADVGEELQRAFEVLVGLALLFVAAAFVEAFLTPRIAALALGG